MRAPEKRAYENCASSGIPVKLLEIVSFLIVYYVFVNNC